MTVDLKQVQEERGQLAVQLQQLADKQNDWTAEDRSKWDELNAEYDSRMAIIDEHQLQLQIEERTKQLQADNERLTRPRPTGGAGSFTGEGSYQPFKPQGVGPTPEQRALAMQGWMLAANDLAVSDYHRDAARACSLNFRGHLDVKVRMRSPMSGFELFSVNNGGLDWRAFDERCEQRDKLELRMDTQTPTEGAEFVPTLFVYELERAMMAFGGFRRIARLFPTSGGNPMEWPTVNDLSNVAQIVAEGTDVGSDTPPTTGQVVFGSYKYSSLPVLVTEELIQDSAFNMAALMGSLLGERLGRGQAVHFATGDGTTQPEGATVGASAGVTALSATAITGDELIDLQGSLDPAYAALPSVGWAFNNTTLTAIRKLKDGNDQYLWRPGLTLAEPDLLLGNRYAVIQEMPNLEASARPILFGAFEKFVIRDVAQMRFYRLVELYRQTDKTGFLALHRTESKVIQAEAIKALTMAAT